MTRMTKPQPEMLRANISTQQQEDQMEIGEGLSAQIVENSSRFGLHILTNVLKSSSLLKRECVLRV